MSTELKPRIFISTTEVTPYNAFKVDGSEMIHLKEFYEWVSVKERTPEMIEGKDYSENVFAWCNGRLRVMAYCYIDEMECTGYCWCNCYRDIEGDPQFDDNYEPTHWKPFYNQQPNTSH